MSSVGWISIFIVLFVEKKEKETGNVQDILNTVLCPLLFRLRL